MGYSPQSHKESVTNSCTTEATEHAHTHVILSSAIQTIQKEKKKGKGDFTRCFRVCWVTEVEQYPLRNYETKTNISDSTAKHSP